MQHNSTGIMLAPSTKYFVDGFGKKSDHNGFTSRADNHVLVYTEKFIGKALASKK